MPKVSTQIEVLAKSICGKGATQEQYELALNVAESEFVVLKVRAARAEVIERMRNVRVPRQDGEGFSDSTRVCRRSDSWRLSAGSRVR